MSYSFNCSGATKDEAMNNVRAELDAVVASQPIHAKDREEHAACVQSIIGLMREPTESEVILVNVSGSCWLKDGEEGLENSSINISVTFRPK